MSTTWANDLNLLLCHPWYNHWLSIFVQWRLLFWYHEAFHFVVREVAVLSVHFNICQRFWNNNMITQNFIKEYGGKGSTLSEFSNLTLHTQRIFLTSKCSIQWMHAKSPKIVHNIQHSYTFQHKGAIFRGSKIKVLQAPTQQYWYITLIER